MRELSDEELVKRIKRDDTAAFETLVVRYQDRIFRLATALARHPDDAADITQEVFLRALTGLAKFRFKSAVFTWLYGTLKNVCREFNRRKRFDAHDPDMISADESCAPDKLTDTGRRMHRVIEAMKTLSQGQRDVVLLRIFEGLSVEETALVLKCRAGTVKAQLHRGLARLRQLTQLELG